MSLGAGVTRLTRSWQTFHFTKRAVPPKVPTTAPPGKVLADVIGRLIQLAAPEWRKEMVSPIFVGSFPASLKKYGSLSFCSHICQSVGRKSVVLNVCPGTGKRPTWFPT